MLLNEHNLAVIACASSNDARPVVGGLYCTPSVTVSTNSFQLLEVSVPSINKDELPDVLETNDTSVLLPAPAIKKTIRNLKSIKSSLPILEKTVAVKVNDEGTLATLTTTDLETTDRVETRVISGKFPDYESVFPPRSKVRTRILLSAKHLHEMAAFFRCHDVHEEILLELWASDKPVVFTGKTAEDQSIRGIIMPKNLRK